MSDRAFHMIQQKLTNDAAPQCLKSAKKGDIEKLIYKGDEEAELLTVEKKVFDLVDDGSNVFYDAENRRWVRK